MFEFLTKLLLVARSRLKSRARLEAENLVLLQQVIVLRRKSLTRVRLRNIDRPILVWLYRFFPSILNAIIVVKPETVIRWHQRGFRANWRWKSRRHSGTNAMGIRDHPTAARSPWQNGHVERLIGSIRRESLDHLIVFGETHLRRVLKAYASYYNEVRTHLSLSIIGASRFPTARLINRDTRSPVGV